MATIVDTAPVASGFKISEWIFTTDHKRIGILYLIGSLAAFLVAGLMALGIIHEPFEFLLYNTTAVVVTLAHAWAAFAILPIYVSLEKIDRSLLEAASDLGDGPIRRFLRITLPLSLPGVIGAAVLIFVPTTGDYVTPTLVGGSDGVMIANVIEVQFAKIGNWPMGAALSIASMAAVGLITLLSVQAVRMAVARTR